MTALFRLLRRFFAPPGGAPARTYRISGDGKSITCLRCGLTSWHPEDVRQVYCGNCHRFHVR
jgi:ribosomal protein L37E